MDIGIAVVYTHAIASGHMLVIFRYERLRFSSILTSRKTQLAHLVNTF